MAVALAAVVWIELPPTHATTIAAAPPVVEPAPAPGGWLDHSALNNPDLLPEPDPSPLSVAAYGD